MLTTNQTAWQLSFCTSSILEYYYSFVLIILVGGSPVNPAPLSKQNPFPLRRRTNISTQAQTNVLELPSSKPNFSFAPGPFINNQAPPFFKKKIRIFFCCKLKKPTTPDCCNCLNTKMSFLRNSKINWNNTNTNHRKTLRPAVPGEGWLA